MFFLDAIQGLGVFPLDVAADGVDFLAADGHKWLLGPEGAGLFYVRGEHLRLLRPLLVGWNSVVQGNDYARIELNIRADAARYEGGSQNMVGFAGLGASLDLLAHLARVGIDAKAGKVAVEGWAESSTLGAIELARRFEDAGVAAIVYTDIERDGILKGLNLPATADLARATAIPVIASGGLASIADVEALVRPEYRMLEGAITGRALYDGRIDPAAALAVLKGAASGARP